jgi:hypothetical protein
MSINCVCLPFSKQTGRQLQEQNFATNFQMENSKLGLLRKKKSQMVVFGTDDITDIEKGFKNDAIH